uniref:Nuclear autoantigenic sperm protein n=1 Tax=Kryptolebias marmoratus TaxID=37003 RepID=A0A3Q3A8F2_KRYMA
MEEANKLVGAGKKYLVTGKVVEAVSALQEACDLLAKTYGETADECGEAFFWCGKALLDLARMENSVLGNALDGVPEEDEDEEKPNDSNVESTESIDEKTRDELRVQVYDAMAEKVQEKQGEDAEGRAGSSEAADEQQKTEKVGDEEEAEDGEKKSETEEKESKTESEEEPTKEDESANKEETGSNEEEEEGGDAEEQGEGDATAEKDSEDEEVGNLQLAWEMLEVAKVIYKRKDAKEEQLMAAQTHLKLGEVSAESGNYTQALEDFQECLKLQLKHLESDSRLLAETHYQLGVTYSLNLQYSEAVEALNNSIRVIKSRLEKLQALLDEAEGPEALPDERKELEELKVLLPEIQEKVEDAAEGLKTAAAEAVKAVLVNSTTTAPVSDISHLVRKKRKPEESPVKEANTKRVKQDDGQEPHTNGLHKANGDKMEVAT